MGNGALPNGLSYRAHPQLYLRDISLGCRIGSLSEQSGHGPTCCRLNSVANDPERHFATVNCRVAKGRGGTSAVLAAAIGACLPCDRSCTQLSDRLDNCSGGAELRAG